MKARSLSHWQRLCCALLLFGFQLESSSVIFHDTEQ